MTSADVVGRSPAFRNLLEEIRRVATFEDVSVLLLGQTGTGKSLAAELLHRASPRRSRPLVAVPCPALPETLFERELFGNERGAYTGADQARPGLASEADTGTLFFEEVGDLGPANQAKLLHFLDGHRFRPLGGAREVGVDVRIVSATNRDLEGPGFRGDLLHRLGGYLIRVPSLAERVEDVPLLASRFVRALAHKGRHSPLPLTAGAIAALVARPWPGNVRELRNVVWQGFVRASSSGASALDSDHLMATDPQIPAVWRQATDAFQRFVLESTLRHFRGNRSASARHLGMARSAFYAHMGRLGLDGA